LGGHPSQIILGGDGMMVTMGIIMVMMGIIFDGVG
jgi:hypothetical protein